jgi:hypothetical protein
MDLEQRKMLVEKITNAFADTPYPQNGYIGAEMQDDFGGKHWQDIVDDVELLLRWRDDLHDFSLEGLRYFLPAFLIAIIRIPDKVDTLVDTIIGVLAPPSVDAVWEGTFRYKARKGGVSEEKIDQSITKFRQQAWERWDRKVNCFNQSQQRVIYDFLSAYKALVPSGNWSVLESEDLELAILFWEELAEKGK